MKRWMSLISCFLVVGLVACGGGGAGDKNPTGPKTRTPDEARRELGELGIQYTEEAFITAIENNDMLAVSLFIDIGMDPTLGLIKAVYDENKIEMIQLLIDKGADVNTKDEYGVTILKNAVGYAVNQARLDIIQILLTAGADVSMEDYSLMFRLDDYVEGWKDYLRRTDTAQQIAELLLDAGIYSNDKNIRLSFAAKYNYVKIIKEFLDTGGDVNIYLTNAAALVRDDDVVQDLYAQDFAGLVQAAGQFQVVLGRLRVSARVAMSQHNG